MMRDANSYVGMPYFMLPEPLGAAKRTILSSVSTTDRSLGGRPEIYFGIVGAFDCMRMDRSAYVEVNRSKEGAARASHETCLRQTPDPMIG